LIASAPQHLTDGVPPLALCSLLFALCPFAFALILSEGPKLALSAVEGNLPFEDARDRDPFLLFPFAVILSEGPKLALSAVEGNLPSFGSSLSLSF
jgi:hypothetical protein